MEVSGPLILEDISAQIGERKHDVERAFSVRVRFTRKDDYTLWKFFEPIPLRSSKGEYSDRDKFERLLSGSIYLENGTLMLVGLQSLSLKH